MDTFMCSSWYFLRFTSPNCDTAPFDAEKVKYWLPVDHYMGGAEHAVMHLLYVRFFTKAIRDMGLVDFSEPFSRLSNQGVITAAGQKMSKSRGNVISADRYISTVGADAFRVYLMFLGPWEHGGEWNDSGISGISRWLNRVWKLVLEEHRVKPEAVAEDKLGDEKAHRDLQRITHQTIRKVTEDLERFRFNTMIAALMEFTNYLAKVGETGCITDSAWEEAIDTLLLLMAPTAPHLTEELWLRRGRDYSIHNQSWPHWDEELAKDEEITLVVQVNGKLRDRIIVPASITEAEARQLALERQRVKAYLEGREITNVIYVPRRLVNFVVK